MKSKYVNAWRDMVHKFWANITAHETFWNKVKWSQMIHFSKTNDHPTSSNGQFLVTQKHRAAIWPSRPFKQ